MIGMVRTARPDEDGTRKDSTTAIPARSASFVRKGSGRKSRRVRDGAADPGFVAADLLMDHCMLDWRDVIRRIDRPTLVVGGAKSIFPAQSQEWIAAQIPGARVSIFAEEEGGSHFMFYENPQAFNALVRDFLG